MFDENAHELPSVAIVNTRDLQRPGQDEIPSRLSNVLEDLTHGVRILRLP